MRKAPRAAWLVGPFFFQERGQTAFGRGVVGCGLPQFEAGQGGLLRGHRDKDLFGGAGSLSDFVMGELGCGVTKIHAQLGQIQVANNAHSADALNLVSGQRTYVPLGTTANKQGRVAGENATHVVIAKS